MYIYHINTIDYEVKNLFFKGEMKNNIKEDKTTEIAFLHEIHLIF